MPPVAPPPVDPKTNPHSYLSWANHIATALGADVSAPYPSSVVALVCWMVKEGSTAGGGSNPLNTKEPWPNAVRLPNGVYRYNNDNDGLQATVKTLKNGYYDAIVTALKQNVDYVTICRYVDSSVWGTKGSTAVALSVKSSGGPKNSAIYLGYERRQVPSTGHSVLNNIPGYSDVHSAYDAVTSGFGAVGDFLGKLTDPHTWYRAGQILLGAILLGLGFYFMLKGTAARAAGSVAGDVAKGVVGKKMGGSSKKGVIASGASEVTPA